MTAPALKIEVATPDFFSIPLKRVEIETVRETGRTYFLFKGRIVAVARRSTTQEEQCTKTKPQGDFPRPPDLLSSSFRPRRG